MSEGPEQPHQPDQPAYPPPTGYGQPPAYGQQPYGQPYGAAWPGGNDGAPVKRPGTVLTACILTWTFAGFTVLAGIVTVLGLASDRDAVVRELRKEPGFDDLGIAPGQFVDLLFGTMVVAMLLSVVAIGAAVLAILRSNAGRILLVVCATLAALVSLVTAIFCLPIVTLIASIATIVLLFSGGANQWYRERT